MIPGHIYKWKPRFTKYYIYHLYKGNRRSIQLNSALMPYSGEDSPIYDNKEECCYGEWTELSLEEKAQLL